MNYYKSKQLAYSMIDKMLEKGNSDEEIINRLMLEYGYGTLMFQRRKEIYLATVLKNARNSGL